MVLKESKALIVIERGEEGEAKINLKLLCVADHIAILSSRLHQEIKEVFKKNNIRIPMLERMVYNQNLI